MLSSRKIATKWYPFGMLAQNYNAKSYLFGFNTQERTDEISGTGNHNTALFWEYNTRLGRRWNIDPKPHVFISDYAVLGNNPLSNTDVLGDTIIVSDATKNNPGFKKWKNSESGKNFYARYGIGGDRENINIEISLVDIPTSFEGSKSVAWSGLTETFIKTKDGLKKVIPKETYEKLLSKRKDVSMYATKVTQNEPLIFKIQFTNTTNSVETGVTILHETQHVRINDYSFQMNGYPKLLNSRVHHMIMLNNYNKPGGYVRQHKMQYSMSQGNGIYDFNAERWLYYKQYYPKLSFKELDERAYLSGVSNLE